MDIIDNRQFFGNLQRIDTTKKSTKYQCRLMVGNKSMLDGTARVSQVTQDTVKVQLLGGNSELNFLSKEEGAYIDEMIEMYVSNCMRCASRACWGIAVRPYGNWLSV